jgi:MoaA/NifB/PqqE/SkfB family radical SAM enzyme
MKRGKLMINKYININRIEFVITNACTSKCRHCSVGDKLYPDKLSIDKEKAISLIAELSKYYSIKSVMTFGGEPLLYADTVCAIHRAAKAYGIPKRQIITNGYFSKDNNRITAIAKALKDSGVNSLLLSIDVFHKEYIPLEQVYTFAKALHDEGIEGLKLHPAWVVDREHDNCYNKETETCLKYFSKLGIAISDGNNIFLAGNAAKYLSEFYERKAIDLGIRCGESPYTTRLDDIKGISVNPNGDIVICSFVIGNIYHENITQIINHYNPYENPLMSALLNGGVKALMQLAEINGVTIDISQYYSACSVCNDIVKKLNYV